MSDDTSQAFEPPMARAVATAGADPLDRISVRDFVKDVEIGAFQSERGVTQRIRFNVVLEVSHSTAAQDDDVDKVISYDTIVEAIEEQLSTERINLLETLAERVAERCLADPRAIRVFVRIEKLDRIPGTLGVEIMRRRITDETAMLHKVEPAHTEPQTDTKPIIVHLPNPIVEGEDLSEWLDSIERLAAPAIITLEMATQYIPAAHEMVERRLSLLSIEQNVWKLAGRDPRCVVVETRTEFDHAAKNHQMTVWAPSKIVLDAVHSPDCDGRDPLDLSLWFAQEIDAGGVVCAGPRAAASPVRTAATPGDLHTLSFD